VISRRHLGPLAAGALLTALSACSNGGSTTSRAEGDSVVEEYPQAERQQFPGVAGATIQQGYVDSDDFPGQILVINVWGSWCVPCREEAPALSRLSAELENEPVQFIGVDIRDNDESALAFEREYGITYPSISSRESGEAMLALGRIIPSRAVPATVVVDPSGRVAARVIGATTYFTLSALIKPLLAEAS
jgi:thiol-disulfide isomerase/thioredoxin